MTEKTATHTVRAQEGNGVTFFNGEERRVVSWCAHISSLPRENTSVLNFINIVLHRKYFNSFLCDPSGDDKKIS